MSKLWIKSPSTEFILSTLGKPVRVYASEDQENQGVVKIFDAEFSRKEIPGGDTGIAMHIVDPLSAGPLRDGFLIKGNEVAFND